MKRVHVENVRLTDLEREMLNKTAEKKGINRSEVLRNSIRSYCDEATEPFCLKPDIPLT
jgi:metal-responsive CopG/Arc/MetJ family transcriptional regulator